MTETLKLIDKLSGENYSVWEVRMWDLLVSIGMGKVKDPNLVDDEETDSKKKVQKLTLIILALGEVQMKKAENGNAVGFAWKNLKSIFAEQSTSNCM